MRHALCGFVSIHHLNRLVMPILPVIWSRPPVYSISWCNQGHQVMAASCLRCRWIYWKPWLWLKLIWERRQVVQKFSDTSADLWFTYHSYYKAPDLLGPAVSRKLNIPYVIFQGIYSTKRRRQWKAKPGFYLNKNSLCAANHVFTNKTVDLLNLKRLLPENRVTYVAPGIIPGEFSFDENARTATAQELEYRG